MVGEPQVVVGPQVDERPAVEREARADARLDRAQRAEALHAVGVLQRAAIPAEQVVGGRRRLDARVRPTQ